ncbi:MAG: hypothetical protein DMG57_39860 [Acidobacteria bacterium]|nr:MAG: hypothetical protein DMG57_39860 [Acidobacteriota bacterium]
MVPPDSSTLLLLSVCSPALAQDTWTGVDRLVAIGDIHGDFEWFTAVLRSAGLLDEDGNWTGGKTHLVQVGDCARSRS